MSLFNHNVFDEIPSKCCNQCGLRKSLDDFHRVNRRRNRDGRFPICKECRSRMSAEYRERNRERLLSKERRARLRNEYNLTPEQYDAMVDAQFNRCAICGSPPSGYRKCHGILSVDHSHKHGYVRDLLCDLCNKMLGQARDNPEILRAAANYLEEHAGLHEESIRRG